MNNVINIHQKTFHDILIDEQDFIRSILDDCIQNGTIYPCDLFGFTSILRNAIPEGTIAHCKVANQWHYGHPDEYRFNFQYIKGEWFWLDKFPANPDIAGLLFLNEDDINSVKGEPFSKIIQKYRQNGEAPSVWHFAQKIYPRDPTSSQNIWKDWVDDRYIIQHLMSQKVQTQFTFLEARIEFDDKAGLVYTAQTVGDDFDDMWTEANVRIAQEKFCERYHIKNTDEYFSNFYLRYIITLNEDELDYALKVINR